MRCGFKRRLQVFCHRETAVMQIEGQHDSLLDCQLFQMAFFCRLFGCTGFALLHNAIQFIAVRLSCAFFGNRTEQVGERDDVPAAQSLAGIEQGYRDVALRISPAQYIHKS